MEEKPSDTFTLGPPEKAGQLLRAVALYIDVHVPGPVILQLRLREVDILAATEEGTNKLPDDELLALSTSLQRVLVTQDIRF